MPIGIQRTTLARCSFERNVTAKQTNTEIHNKTPKGDSERPLSPSQQPALQPYQLFKIDVGELARKHAHTLREACAAAGLDHLAPKLARNLRTPCANDPFVTMRAIHISAKLNFLCEDLFINAHIYTLRNLQ